VVRVDARDVAPVATALLAEIATQAGCAEAADPLEALGEVTGLLLLLDTTELRTARCSKRSGRRRIRVHAGTPAGAGLGRRRADTGNAVDQSSNNECLLVAARSSFEQGGEVKLRGRIQASARRH
jgi:hypothetical protein